MTGIEQRYHNAGIFRAAIDAPPDRRLRAYLPRPSEIKNLLGPRIREIGRNYGAVQLLATGLQSIEGQDGELTNMTLFGSRGEEHVHHHYAFWHGGEQDIERDAVIGILQECPGMYFDLNCGCSNCRDRVVKDVFDADANAAILISYAPETTREERRSVGQGVLESLGVREVRHLLTPRFERDCSLQFELKRQKKLHDVYVAPDNKVYIRTHDMPVSFTDGEPAQMLVFQEQSFDERHGFDQKNKTHYVLVYGDIHNSERPPVARYHSSCKTAEHGGNACDCRMQREKTIELIRNNGSGIFIYADEEGMNLGAVNKFWQTHFTLGEIGDVYAARDILDMPRDVRTYSLIDVVRRSLGLQNIVLASNNRSKKRAFELHGVEVVASNHLIPDYSRLAAQATADVHAKIDSGNYEKFT
jgi:GTP cyclohydrolase II